MYFSFLLSFILINSQVEASYSCNDECLTKTYCVSSDGSGVCSENNLVTAQFKVTPVFGTYDPLQLTIKGYHVKPNDEKLYELSFASPLSQNVYTCHKSSDGKTYVRFDRGTYRLLAGSSSYKDGVLSCTWNFNFNFNDTVWPLNLDLIKDSSQSITLSHDYKKVIVAQDTSELPIYHAQYLQCCNKVYGNDSFLLSFDRIDDKIRYQLYYWKNNSNEVTLTLTRKDGIELQFKCNLNSGIEGYITDGTERISINQQLVTPVVVNSEICFWGTPLVLGNSTISINASNSVFDLKVEDDIGTVYNEKDVILNMVDPLKSSSHLVKLSFFLITFAVLFQILLI